MIEFAAPWLLATLLLPTLGGAVAWRALRAGSEAAGRIGGPFLPVRRATLTRSFLGFVVVVAMALAVVAAARPLWGEGTATAAQRGVDLVVLLDISRSMEAEDIAPSRAQAASSGIQELLTHLLGSRVGLVTFAGSAFTRAPLTSDLDAVSSLIARSQGEAPLVQAGTDLQAAIVEGLEVLDVRDPAATRVMLLVSDGEDLGSSYDEAIAAAVDRGVRIYTVFVGTTGSVPLPEDRGQADVSEADPDLLAAIAEASGGSSRTVDRLAGFAVDFRRLQQTTFEELPQTRPQEQFAWFAGAAAVLLVLSMLNVEGRGSRLPRLTRGVITSTVALVIAMFLAACGSAAWQSVERGHEAYRQGDFAAALEAYRAAAEERPDDAATAYNVARALFELGRHAEAIEAADAAQRLAIDTGNAALAVSAAHLAGNAAFLREDLETARGEYESALRLDPMAADAKANLELVLAILAPPPPPPPPETTGSEGSEGEGEGEDGGDGAGEGEGGSGAGEAGGAPDDLPASGTPGTAGQPSTGGTPGGAPIEGAPGGAAEFMTVEDVNAAIADLLAEIGPELSSEEALRLLELSRRANELQGLPVPPGGGQTPR